MLISIVGPATSPPCSGETDGLVTNQPYLGCCTSVSTKKRLGAFHNRIGFAQEVFIARELVMLPQMSAKPGAAHRPHSPVGAINGRGGPPCIGVVMSHPTACAPHHFGCFRAGLRDFAHHLQQRLVTLAQIGGFRRPVVHLGVDVDGVFRLPRRRSGSIPDALKVGRLVARTRRRNQQITPILKVEADQLWIGSRGEALLPHIGRRFGGLTGADIKRNATKKALVISDMVLAQFVGGELLRRRDTRGGERIGVASDIVVVFVIGRRIQHDQR